MFPTFDKRATQTPSADKSDADKEQQQSSLVGKLMHEAYSHMPEKMAAAATTVAQIGVVGAAICLERGRAASALAREAEVVGGKLLMPSLKEFAGSSRLAQDATSVAEKVFAVDKEFAEETPGVVMVNTLLPHGKGLARGSGTIIREDGIVSTNYHVVKGSGIVPLVTTSSGEVLSARLLARDKVADIAFLKIIDEHPEPFHPVKLAPLGAGVNDVAVLEYSGKDNGLHEVGPGHIVDAWLSSSEKGYNLSLHPERKVLSPEESVADTATSARRADFIEVCTDLDCQPGTSGGGIFTSEGQIGIVRGGGVTKSMGKVTLGTHVAHMKAMLNALPEHIPNGAWYDMLTRAEVRDGKMSVGVIKMTEIPWEKSVAVGAHNHIVPDDLNAMSDAWSDDVKKHLATQLKF